MVNGDNGVGMGYGAIVQQTAPGGIALGENATVNFADAVALGTNATASGIQSLSFGAGATTTTPTSVALGAGASAGAQAGDVALGSGSTTTTTTDTTGTTINGIAYTFAGTTPASTVSVGSAGNERTITNVAAGQITAASTDAVNGSELYATNQAVAAVGSSPATRCSMTMLARPALRWAERLDHAGHPDQCRAWHAEHDFHGCGQRQPAQCNQHHCCELGFVHRSQSGRRFGLRSGDGNRQCPDLHGARFDL